MTRARVAVALALALGCRARHRPEVVVDAPESVTDEMIDAAVDASAARRCIAVEAVVGAVRGVAGGRLCEGATVVTDAASSVALVGASRFEVGALSEVRMPAREGAALVAGRGAVAVVAPLMAPEPARVDTPAGRVIVSSGRALVAVADDGSVRVAAEEGAVTVWPAPEGDAVTPVAMRPGDVVTFSVTGAREPGRTERALGARLRASTMRWLAARNAGLRIDDVTAALARAKAGDALDAADASVRLRLGRELSGRERDRLEARGSLALGRAEARAMRAAALRARGAQRDS